MFPSTFQLLLIFLAAVLLWILTIAVGYLIVEFIVRYIFFFLGLVAGIALWVIWR